MAGHDKANVNWAVEVYAGRSSFTTDQAQLAILMDIRTELNQANSFLREISRKLNPLNCGNFLKIPRTLNRIANNTAKKRKPKKEKA